MMLKQTLERLEALGNEKIRRQEGRRAAGSNQFGVALGEIRKLAKEIKSDHELGMNLWDTGNLDAQLLAILLFKPKLLTLVDLEKKVRSVSATQVADWFTAYVLKKHPDAENLRQGWMTTADPWAARAGWSLTADQIEKNSVDLDLKQLLDRIEKEMATAAPEVQWTMNNSLVAIGINQPKHRKRATEIGEKLGLYRDYPVSKGCTSPFAPVWIKTIVARR